MSKTLAALDRFFIGILAAALLGSGIVPILEHFGLWRFSTVAWQSRVRNLDRYWGQGWFMAVLAAASIIFIVVGIVLIVVHVRTRRITKIRSDASDASGVVTFAMPTITAGIAKSLEEHDYIVHAKRQLSTDQGRNTLSFEVIASPEVSWHQLAALMRETEQDFRAAFPESDCDTSYRVYYAKLEPLA